MSLRRPLPRSTGKRHLLVGAALAAVCASAAHAQPAKGPAVSDGMAKGELYIEADEVIREDKTGRTSAKGNI